MLINCKKNRGGRGRWLPGVVGSQARIGRVCLGGVGRVGLSVVVWSASACPVVASVGFIGCVALGCSGCVSKTREELQTTREELQALVI